MLDRADFDKTLAASLKDFFGEKQHGVILVFDSNDVLGDRLSNGNIEIIYTPRDRFYKNADDKILEIVGSFLANDDFKEEIFIITDDLDLQEKIRAAIAYHAKRRRVTIEGATEFASRMELAAAYEANKNLSDKSAAEEESGELNAELLKIWSKPTRGEK